MKKMSGHYIIAGYGRVGRQVAREFDRSGVEFIVIEKGGDTISKLLADGYNYIEGDATDEDILHQARIDKADTLISTLPEEAQNVYLTLTAKQLNDRLKVIARADFEEGEKKLIRAGADHVVIPHVIGGTRMAYATLRPNVVDFMQIASQGEEGLTMEEIVIPRESKLHEKTLQESNLKKDYGVTIIGIKPSGGRMRLNPEPSTKLSEGDTLVLIGQLEFLEKLNRDMNP
jgi:voltage-gated potassium channel